MMKTSLALLCLTVGVQGFPWTAWKERRAATNCIGFLDSVVEGILTRGDYSAMNALVDEEKFVSYVLPGSLGAPVDGYNITGYQDLTDRLIALDYFTAFEVIKQKKYISSTGFGRHAKYNCVVLGYSVAVTESGRNYGQNYSFTVEMDSSLKVTTYYEQSDSLYSLCFYQVLPAAFCAAVGL